MYIYKDRTSQKTLLNDTIGKNRQAARGYFTHLVIVEILRPWWKL
jgi:hypothetical protein